jgi:hypothetical protein
MQNNHFAQEENVDIWALSYILSPIRHSRRELPLKLLFIYHLIAAVMRDCIILYAFPCCVPLLQTLVDQGKVNQNYFAIMPQI